MGTLEVLGQRCVLGVLLGAGGMGKVYAVTHPDLGSLAVKLLLSSRGCIDEARIGALVHHRNVVRIVDHGVTDDGSPFLAMERIAGVSLGQVIARCGPLALERIRAIAAQLLAGLAAIHGAGLIHADLKSDNILIDEVTDQVTIIDFGLTRSSPTTLSDEKNEVISGTPEYMAPELIRGAQLTAAIDLYAIGVILYELVTGTTPFAGGSSDEILTRQLEDDVVPPSLRAPDRSVPPALEAAILAALVKDPDIRPHDSVAFAQTVIEAIPETDDVEPHFHHQAFSPNGPTCRWTHGVLDRTLPVRRGILGTP